MSDPLKEREKAIEAIRARLLDARTEAQIKATEANQAATVATQAAIDCKKRLDDAIKANESSSVQEVDPDDEWGDLDVEDPSITKLRIESNKLATEAERLNKAAEQASRTYEAISTEPTEAEIKREISLLRGAATKAANIAEEQRRKKEKEDEIAKREALQEEESRKIREAEEQERRRQEEYFNSLSEIDKIKCLEIRKKSELAEAKRKFILKYKNDRGWTQATRGTDSRGRPCCTAWETKLNQEAEDEWYKEQAVKEAEQVKANTRVVQKIKTNCSFQTCFRYECGFYHSISQYQYQGSRPPRKICKYNINCGNNRCKDLHIEVGVELGGGASSEL